MFDSDDYMADIPLGASNLEFFFIFFNLFFFLRLLFCLSKSTFLYVLRVPDRVI